MALEKVLGILIRIDFEENKLRTALDELGKELGDRGLAYWPIRVALTGKEKSPDPVDVMSGLLVSNDKTGQIEILQRIEDAIKKLK